MKEEVGQWEELERNEFFAMYIFIQRVFRVGVASHHLLETLRCVQATNNIILWNGAVVRLVLKLVVVFEQGMDRNPLKIFPAL